MMSTVGKPKRGWCAYRCGEGGGNGGCIASRLIGEGRWNLCEE